jgi:DNA-binding MarR family transcriptional regulator
MYDTINSRSKEKARKIIMKERSLEDLELELAILYRRISSITSHHKIGNLDRSGYLLLHQITSHGSAGVKALADEFKLDISTVSRQAAVLEHKGYIYKIPNPKDGRSYSFQITELGLREYNEFKKARLNRVTEVLGNWSPEELKTFAALLNKFNRSVLKKS